MGSKRIWARSSLTALAIAIVLSGCWGKDVEEGRDTGHMNRPSPKTKLKFTSWGGSQEQQAFEDIFSKFTEKHPNIEIEYMFIPYPEYLTKLNTMAVSGTLPDLGQMMESATVSWSERGMFEDMSPVLNELPKKLRVSYFSDTTGGKVGPSFISEIITLFYSKDVFADAGVPFPPADAESAWTWDQFLDACIRLTEDERGRHPGEAGFDASRIRRYGVNIGLWELGWLPFAISNGGGFTSEDGSKLLIDDPRTIEAIQNVADLMNVHHVMPTPSQRKSLPQADTAFLTGQTAMSIDGTWGLLALGKAVKDEGLNLGVAVLPKYEKPVTMNTGPAIVVFKNTKHKEEALELYKFINDSNNIIPNLNSGLWISNEEAWYNDPELIRKWTDTPIHPPEYRTAVIDYAIKSTVQTPYYYTSSYSKMFDIINPALDQVWTGERTAEDVIRNDIMPKIRPIFAEDQKRAPSKTSISLTK